MSVPPARPWLRHYPPQIPRDIESVPLPIGDYVREAARTWPENTATLFYGTRIPYAKFDEMVDRLATALHQQGVRQGDRVAMYMPNCPQYAIADFAVLRLGAIVVNFNPLYVERELEHQLKDSGAETIIALDQLLPRVQAVRAQTPIKRVIGVGLLGPGKFPPDILSFDTLIKTPPDPPHVKVDLDDIALLQYTGGTTGVPKCAVHTHRTIGAQIAQLTAWFIHDQPGKERILLVMPLFHAYGMVTLFRTLYQGGTVILLPRFELEDFLNTIEKTQPTWMPAVPTIFTAIINHPRGPEVAKSIRTCLSGAAPLPLEVLRRYEALTGGIVAEGYGMTEMCAGSHLNPPFGQRKIGSVGIPLPGVDTKIVDANDGHRELPPGEPGELIMRGPQMMREYWNRPEETAKVLRDGWLYTGDIAKMDEDGYFYIVDRKKDMLLCGGYNVYPVEIEGVLYEHPKVLEAAVTGVPDEYRGESPKAHIVLKPGQTATPDEIIAYCRTKLAAYKVPRHVEFRASLPKTPIGKILRKELREER
ncbi:MAG: long-chain fatty acid--CoA ligase [Euryarchaeota archaeon]|nr:long-chain fatty acid--CoA ligase [Euryarchaeota archaeon]